MATRTLKVNITGDDRSLSRVFGRSESRVERFSRRLGAAGATLTRGLTLPLAGVGFAAGKLASDMGELQDFTRDVFKKNADAVIAWSETLIDKFGVGSDEALGFANRAGSLFNATGITAAKSLGMIQAATGRIGDVASQTNEDISRVAAAYQAGLKGNFERLDEFGVVVKASTVQQRALEMGLADTTSELSEQDKQLAFHELFMEQSSNAQGNFARTSDSAANQTRVLKERSEQLGREFGQKLLPIVNKLLKWAIAQTERFSKLTDSQQSTIIKVVALAAALGPLLSVASKMILVVQALSKALLFLNANPISLVIIGVAALAAGLIYAYQKSETFRKVVDTVFRFVANLIRNTVAVVLVLFQGMLSAWLVVMDKILAAAIGVMRILKPDWAEKLRGMRDNIRDFRVKANEQIDKVKKTVEVKAKLDRSAFNEALKKLDADVSTPRLLNASIRMRDRVGDGPGRGAGPALARARALASGLPISMTSSYRSPSHNAAVGGSPTSFHMDRGNPASDWAGPTWALDTFAARLRAAGGWRELIWRAPGHYDHVHVAHQGGTVDPSWPTMPGLRADERPAILQTGETVTPRGGGAVNVTVLIDGREIRRALKIDRQSARAA